MEFNEYQELASRTRSKLYAFGSSEHLAVNAMGLCGEAGEVADIIKKIIGHGHPMDLEAKDRIKKELGDILWYVAEMTSAIGLGLHEIAYANIDKLKARYPEGFSTERSVNRPAESSEPAATVLPPDPFAATAAVAREAILIGTDGKPCPPPEHRYTRNCPECGQIVSVPISHGGYFQHTFHLHEGRTKGKLCPGSHRYVDGGK